MNLLHEAISHHKAGRLGQAAALYRRVLQASAGEPNALRLLAVIELQSGNLDEAQRLLARALAVHPGSADAHYFMGRVLLERKEHGAARNHFHAVVRIDPRHADALICLGNLARHDRDPASGLDLYGRAVAANPAALDAHVGRAHCLLDLGRAADALVAYDHALSLQNANTSAWTGRGNALLALQRIEDALGAFDKAISIDARHAAAWTGRGNAHFARGAYKESASCYRQAIALDPDLPGAWTGVGNVLANLSEHREALTAYDRAIACKPDMVEAWIGRGNCCGELGRYEDALAAFRRSIALDGRRAEAFVGLGNVLVLMKRSEDAVTAYDQALAVRADLAEAWSGRGNALGQLNRFEEAVAAYDRALDLDPSLRFVRGQRLHFKMSTCDWTGHAAELDDLLARLDAGEAASNPFCLLAVASTLEQRRRCAQTFVAATTLPVASPRPTASARNHEGIRIAYVSADFTDHPVAYLVAGLLENHDRGRFDVAAVSLTPDHDSRMRARIRNAVDRFIVVAGRGDEEVAMLMGEMEIDIAVDLMGLTGNSRIGIFAHRAAPVQVTYLGCGCTTGADFIDYLVGDRIAIPPQEERFYSEKIAFLPDTLQVNDAKREISTRPQTRREQALPESGFVFCAFNNPYKITPGLFDIWMRLLRNIDGSVLWLLSSSPAVVANLRREADARGVSPDRLVFAPRVPNAEHIARCSLADLFLDTLPCNGGATTSDALWAGLPVLTCTGDGLVGRMSASLLNAVGLPEMVTNSLSDYEATALKLARAPDSLAGVRARLARNRTTHPLFDTARFTRHIEAAYVEMHERRLRGEPPASFHVAPIG